MSKKPPSDSQNTKQLNSLRDQVSSAQAKYTILFQRLQSQGNYI